MVAVDRGAELEGLRRAGVLTDVVLVAGDSSIPAHSLILSLHSAYFRTLFQSRGFVESQQERVAVSLEPALLSSLVSYLYTGQLELEAATATDLLEAAELLQLEEPGEQLKAGVAELLASGLTGAASMEELFPLWDAAATYSLPALLERVVAVVAGSLGRFLASARDRPWLARLGWQEVAMLLDRTDLCVQSEEVLLQLVLHWAEGKVEEAEDVAMVEELLGKVGLDTLERKHVARSLAGALPGVRVPPGAGTRALPVGRPGGRRCTRCSYMVEYKLAKGQLRQVEDFVDQGQKSLFLSIGLEEGATVRRLPRLSSMASMVGTAAGHYGRPVTRGSTLLAAAGLLAVLGGEEDAAKETKGARTDVLLFDTATGCWRTSLKQHLRARPRCRLAEVLEVGGMVYLVWQPVEVAGQEEHSRGVMRALLEGGEGVVERMDLGAAAEAGRVCREVVSPLPTALHRGALTSCTLGTSLYLLGEGELWSLQLEGLVWTRHQPPLGSVGARPLLAPLPPLLCLVGGRPGPGDPSPTNTLQVYDPSTHTWRGLPPLPTRLTPLHLLSHSSLLYLVAWQPSRQNLVMELEVRGEEVHTKVLLQGLEGVWSKGVLLGAHCALPD